MWILLIVAVILLGVILVVFHWMEDQSGKYQRMTRHKMWLKHAGLVETKELIDARYARYFTPNIGPR